MRMLTKFLTGATGFAALAAAAPSAAQYYGSQYSPYSYNQQRSYGYAPYAMNSSAAAQQCTAAVQNRLYNRTGIGGILGAVLGANTQGRVLSITQATPTRTGMRIRGLASSGRMASNGYGPYGVGAYGGAGLRLCQPGRPVVPLRRRLPRLCPQRGHQSPLLTLTARRRRSAGFAAGALFS